MKFSEIALFCLVFLVQKWAGATDCSRKLYHLQEAAGNRSLRDQYLQAATSFILSAHTITQYTS